MLNLWYTVLPRSPVAALLVVPLCLLGLLFLLDRAGPLGPGTGLSSQLARLASVQPAAPANTRVSRHNYGDKASSS